MYPELVKFPLLPQYLIVPPGQLALQSPDLRLQPSEDGCCGTEFYK